VNEYITLGVAPNPFKLFCQKLIICVLVIGGLASEPGDHRRMSAALLRDLLVHAPAEALCLGAERNLPSTETGSVSIYV